MSKNSNRTPNDQRSDVKNPNNREYEADQANREAQAARNAEQNGKGDS